MIVNSHTGELIPPSSDFPEPVEGNVLSSPAVSSDGYVVFGSTAGKLYALHGKTGTSAWAPITLCPAPPCASGSPIHSSVAIDANGTIWVGSDDGNLYRVAEE